MQELDIYRSGSIPGEAGSRFAISRVDAVGHSMGGQVIRFYVSNIDNYPRSFGFPPGQRSSSPGPLPSSPRIYKSYIRSHNFYCGNIRRFVALGSPFKGDFLGNTIMPLLEPLYSTRDAVAGMERLDSHEFTRLYSLAYHMYAKFGSNPPPSSNPTAYNQMFTKPVRYYKEKMQYADFRLKWDRSNVESIIRNEVINSFSPPTALHDLQVGSSAYSSLSVPGAYQTGRTLVPWLVAWTNLELTGSCPSAGQLASSFAGQLYTSFTSGDWDRLSAVNRIGIGGLIDINNIYSSPGQVYLDPITSRPISISLTAEESDGVVNIYSQMNADGPLDFPNAELRFLGFQHLWSRNGSIYELNTAHSEGSSCEANGFRYQAASIPIARQIMERLSQPKTTPPNSTPLWRLNTLD